MMTAAHRRFEAWFKWRDFKSQQEVATLLGCKQATVSNLLRGEKSLGLRFAIKLEALTADWPEGPIAVNEWVARDADQNESPKPEPAAPGDAA